MGKNRNNASKNDRKTRKCPDLHRSRKRKTKDGFKSISQKRSISQYRDKSGTSRVVEIKNSKTYYKTSRERKKSPFELQKNSHRRHTSSDEDSSSSQEISTPHSPTRHQKCSSSSPDKDRLSKNWRFISPSKNSSFQEFDTPPYTPTRRQKYSKSSPNKQSLSRNPSCFTFFWKKESPFSQFYPAYFSLYDQKYISTEQYMMAAKARVFQDDKNLLNIMKTNDPELVKAFGRQVTNFQPDIWKMCCRQIVYEGNLAKFSQTKHLFDKLIATIETHIVEANPYDTLWGIGLEASHVNACTPSLWRGSNWLGEILNRVRFELRSINRTCTMVNDDENTTQCISDTFNKFFRVGMCKRCEKMNCVIKISEFPPELEVKFSQSEFLACLYIFTGWARERILDSLDVLSFFMNLDVGEVREIPGYFTYTSDQQFIQPNIHVSYVLIALYREFFEIKCFIEKFN